MPSQAGQDGSVRHRPLSGVARQACADMIFAAATLIVVRDG